MQVITAKICAITNMGKVRTNNEDNFNINGKELTEQEIDNGVEIFASLSAPFVLGVFDGMGGEEFGELASSIAVKTLSNQKDAICSSREQFRGAINNCIQSANEEICAQIEANGKRLGTTASIIYAYDDKLVVANVGDSRIYRFSKGSLMQVSVDHTEVQSQISAGLITPEQANKSKNKHKLTQHLGIFPTEMIIEPETKIIEDVKMGDVLLLCSDGLTDMVDDAQIQTILTISKGAEDAARVLVKTALENGGKDNVTVVVAALSFEERATLPVIANSAGKKTTVSFFGRELTNSAIILSAIACIGLLLFIIAFGVSQKNIQDGNDNGLPITNISSVENETVSETIISQSTQKDEMLASSSAITKTDIQGKENETDKTGSTVKIVSSTSSGKVSVPNVIGKQKNEAKISLESAGLEISITYEFSDLIANDIIISQSKKQGENIPMGSVVNLISSKGKEQVTVPDVVGKTYMEAKTAIEGVKLIIIRAPDDYSDTLATGRIIKQDIAKNKTVPKGTAVTVTVSKGIEQVVVPKVINLTYTEAKTLIEDANLDILKVEKNSDTIEAGRVISQNMTYGLTVNKGTIITVTVSKGVEQVVVPDVLGENPE